MKQVNEEGSNAEKTESVFCSLQIEHIFVLIMEIKFNIWIR